ncbi:ABC-F family ATP-binding cassette domain-containing protein [Desulfobulbus oligotrophicus]|jgi:ATP-binding cassette subfamily F protein 3|uniref:Probable ATP-binding protein YbiT n=1 Tax=Desulfobulbus oligotrophicus TaxID=1909699 RepID=A0A7T5VBF2_9BACT|nr:ABC-F family ATP-binding cassette domain-containing protein [Desulfobulbus oligotrophicus]MDY0390490.1 ABC-F family ATP-binding cassette domain-containing protein [Desulfobulbus oligotrophicus]QQG64783.1 ABC-F family ATP-binding cassette domain-containing protein [Desulfobulbus oligotrophicus]
MLSITDLNLQYGNKHIFRDVSVQIHSGDRVGLVGVNGAGKSTLLTIMCGEQDVDPGIVNRASWFTVAYLPQETTVELGGVSLFTAAESAFDEVLAQQEELDRISEELALVNAEDPGIDDLLRRQGELQHMLEGSDVFLIRPQIEQVLFGLGFTAADLDRPVNSFSGGWIMRLLLARLLLKRPALLLLDEPTNHLDLDSLTWLEEFLINYQGAMVIISHDRSFLDRVTSATWELSLGRLSVFRGNYSHYIVEKEQRLELERSAYDNQQAMIRQTERFITRFRAKSTKARQVQSRVKQLEKLERIELSATDHTIHFSFPPAAPSGRDVLLLDGVRKSYHSATVFDGISFSLHRGDKLAVVGVNGAGKTTLLKILAGLVIAEEGTVKLGHNVILSYFGQHQAQELPGELTVFDTVYHTAVDMSMTQVRSLLGAFLFSGDDVEKQVQVLSGGEKSRVALARMLVRPANLLLLDEPTNHLDMSSQEILQEAMAQYEGTIIVVSHNRYFVNSFVNKVLEIRNGTATLHEGNIDDYLAWRRKMEMQEVVQIEPAADRTGMVRKDQGETDAGVDKKSLRRQRARERQQLNQKLGPWKKKNEEAEREVESLEARKTELEQLMADPELYGDQEQWSAVSREYSQVERHLDRAYQRWEETQQAVEEIEQEFAQTGV